VAIEELLDRGAVAYALVPQAERCRIEQGWREVYARNTHARTGKWRLSEFEWHVFSFGDAPHVAGGKAVELFGAESPPEWVVWPQASNAPMYRVSSGSHLALLSLADDVYVFPPDFSWTMAFTHEYRLGLGPYFARREWQ
jgi:hypothetical protein